MRIWGNFYSRLIPCWRPLQSKNLTALMLSLLRIDILHDLRYQTILRIQYLWGHAGFMSSTGSRDQKDEKMELRCCVYRHARVLTLCCTRRCSRFQVQEASRHGWPDHLRIYMPRRLSRGPILEHLRAEDGDKTGSFSLNPEAARPIVDAACCVSRERGACSGAKVLEGGSLLRHVVNTMSDCLDLEGM